jgi:predicted nucleic acid-binding protein
VRIVLDTNVLIAAFIARGFRHQLFEHCGSHHHLMTSEFILGEVRLVEKFKHTKNPVTRRSLIETFIFPSSLTYDSSPAPIPF